MGSNILSNSMIQQNILPIWCTFTFLTRKYQFMKVTKPYRLDNTRKYRIWLTLKTKSMAVSAI